MGLETGGKDRKKQNLHRQKNKKEKGKRKRKRKKRLPARKEHREERAAEPIQNRNIFFLRKKGKEIIPARREAKKDQKK